MYGKLVWSTNQQRNLNHIGLSFLTIPYLEGQDPWSSQDLNLLISKWKLKAKNGAVQELFHHVLTNPSTQCSQYQSYQLCQWTIQFHHHWQLRLRHCNRETFLSVTPVQFNLPSQAVVQQWQYQAPLEDLLTLPREFHPWVSLLPSSELCTMEHYGSQWKGYFCFT